MDGWRVRRLRVFILGALNGALYSVIMLLLAWWVRASEYARNIREAESLGHLPVQLTSNERWTPIVVTWVLIFALAALVVDRFWVRNKASVLFWETIGLLAVIVWNVFILSVFWLEQQMSAQTMIYAWLRSSNPILGPISLGVVLIINFVYAQVVIRTFEHLPVDN